MEIVSQIRIFLKLIYSHYFQEVVQTVIELRIMILTNCINTYDLFFVCSPFV